MFHWIKSSPTLLIICPDLDDIKGESRVHSFGYRPEAKPSYAGEFRGMVSNGFVRRDAEGTQQSGYCG